MNKISKSKTVRALLIAALTGGLVFSLAGCTSGQEEAAPQVETAAVTRGDITVDITAAGNLSYALEEDLAFAAAGWVEDILVEEGDAITEGQLLAWLDTSDLEMDIVQAEASLLQAEASQKSALATLEQAEENLKTLKRQNIHGYRRDIAELNLEAAELQLSAAELNLGAAQDSLAEAQEELEGATIVAPFDGFVTHVNIEGGDEVYKGTVAVQAADPDKFKSDLLVSESDIFKVALGGEAVVAVDSQPMLSIPAGITYISPTATIESGVVNYEVEVELESLEALKREMKREMQQQQAAKQEHSEAMTAMLDSLQLKEGLNVTVSIIVDEATDVILVPNQAITYQGMNASVQVMTDGAAEERSIQIGINDWQYTEVVSGLSEGEQVVVPEAAATSTIPEQPRGVMGGPPPDEVRIMHGATD